MRAIILYSLFAVAAIATPIAIELEGGKQLDKRGTDNVIADVVKALLTFGAFIWGGGIISKRAINFYFEKKAKLDADNRANNMRMDTAIRKVQSTSSAEKKRAAEMADMPEAEALMDDVD
jgi:hypothetical protein